MENMTDSKVIDRILTRADDDGMWQDEAVFKDLRVAVRVGEQSNRVIITEGSSERWVDVRAVNFVTLGVFDPQKTFGLLRDEAPNNGEDLLEGFRDSAMVNASRPQVREDVYSVCRTKRFVRMLCELAATLANDTREGNYTYRAYRVLADSERKLGIGTNPLGSGVKEFYGHRGPVRILPNDPEADEEPDVETTSAADADW